MTQPFHPIPQTAPCTYSEPDLLILGDTDKFVMLSAPVSPVNAGRKKGAGATRLLQDEQRYRHPERWICNPTGDKLQIRTIFQLEETSLTFRSQPGLATDLICLIQSQNANLLRLWVCEYWTRFPWQMGNMPKEPEIQLLPTSLQESTSAHQVSA